MTDDGPGLHKRLRYETVRISSQHEKLNQLYADVARELARRARHKAFVCFGRLRDALEAHFDVEDRVYFPAVHGFRPEYGELLDALSRDHVAFRKELSGIHRLLEANEVDESRRLLDQLVTMLQAHERREDALLAELTSAPASGTGGRGGSGRAEMLDPMSSAFAPIQRSPVDPE
jgi:hemerythrin